MRDHLRIQPGVSSAVLFCDSVHAVLDPPATIEGLTSALAATGLEAAAVRRGEPSLEDVFLQLMEQEHTRETEPAA